MKQGVVITGAGKGIGRACVQWLAREGFRVFAGVRNTAAGDELVAENSGDVVPIIIDVTDPATIAAAAAYVSTDGCELRGLVNNAGIAVAGPLEFVPVEELRRQLEVNVIGQVAVTQAFLPQLRTTRGRIINMGSISGRSALPMTGPYAASKFALEAITDAMRVELMPAGIDVVIVEPGMIATPIWETSIKAADKVVDQMPPQMMEYYGRIVNAVRKRATSGTTSGQPAELVARVVHHALTANRPKTRYVVGRDARFRLLLQHLPDRWRDRLIARQLARM